MSAIPSFGTFIKMSDSSMANHSTIAEVLDIDGPQLKADTKETTSHSSGIPWKTFVTTLLEGGDVKFMCNYMPDDPTHDALAGLRAVYANREKRNYQIINNDEAGNQVDSFDAFITDVGRKSPVNGVYDMSVTLRITGAVTLG